MDRPPRLHDRTAIITGANQGIGAATARAFAREGARLHLWDRRADGIGAVAEAVRAAGGEAHTREVDVTDPAQVDAAMATAEQALGHVDILVNCAGVFHAGPLVDYPLAEWERVMAVNVTGTMLCCQAALKRMIPRGYGKIVNLSSIAGRRGNKQVSAYAASKHAVIGLTRSAALEVAEYGITVNAICPGYVNTEMFDGVLSGVGGHTGQVDAERVRQTMLRNVPIGRMQEPEEIAGVAVFLASAETDGMTGQALVYAGGLVQA
ncbi:MAG TPA: SDR family NAD(P)-dependent oxidoreductase [bacterium]|nr:SDR family NAD(P)-dependent oxidoreductase [bacterium]